jgi:hypothetical protein
MGHRGALFGIILVICLFAGSASAISNATLSTSNNLARWQGSTTSASKYTTGGNISQVNISSVIQLTTKWADFYGSVSGASIRLRDSGGSDVYTWDYSTANGSGVVCLSTGSVFPGPTSSLMSANLSAMNSLWGLGTIDNASNTFNTTFGGLNISGTVFSPVGARLQGSSSFSVAAISNGTNSTKNAFSFCTNISSSGTNYAGISSNYELMVPTTPSGVETYYFYIELST